MKLSIGLLEYLGDFLGLHSNSYTCGCTLAFEKSTCVLSRENERQRGRLLVQALGYVNSTKVIYRWATERKSVFRDVRIKANLDLMFLVKQNKGGQCEDTVCQ